MLIGAYIFVFVIFLALGASFLATTITLAHEFWDANWVDFLAVDSHLFVFFPTFGIVALVAFYLPSVAIVDHYWRHVALGKLRFFVGFVVAVIASLLITHVIDSSPNRSMWEIAPTTLLADRGDPANCTSEIARGASCERLPLLLSIHNLRQVSQTRLGLAPLIRQCERDPLIEGTGLSGPRRLCLASTMVSDSPRLSTDEECCRAQHQLSAAVKQRYAAPDQQSLTGKVHRLLLPLKVFFLIVLLAISILLTIRFAGMQTYYANKMVQMEIGIIVGTIATLFFPLMSQAFLQSIHALYGEAGQGNFSTIVPLLSFAFLSWTLLMVLFFYRRHDKNAELLGKVGGATAGIVALLKYDVIVDVLVRAIGSGASWYVIALLGILAFLATIVTIRLLATPPSRSVAGSGD